METFYLFLVIFLFVLAIVDLSVGVSNDAVNFLNSAIGARAASFKVIIAIAAVGVFVGAALSNGMMDIARHGIYQPQHFYFSEIDLERYETFIEYMYRFIVPRRCEPTGTERCAGNC